MSDTSDKYEKPVAMTFSELHSRFLAAIHHQIDNGVWTERQLARWAGISQTHCHDILNGRREGTLEMLDRLAAAPASTW